MFVPMDASIERDWRWPPRSGSVSSAAGSRPIRAMMTGESRVPRRMGRAASRPACDTAVDDHVGDEHWWNSSSVDQRPAERRCSRKAMERSCLSAMKRDRAGHHRRKQRIGCPRARPPPPTTRWSNTWAQGRAPSPPNQEISMITMRKFHRAMLWASARRVRFEVRVRVSMSFGRYRPCPPSHCRRYSARSTTRSDSVVGVFRARTLRWGVLAWLLLEPGGASPWSSQLAASFEPPDRC